MSTLYVISGATGMTGNELSRQIVLSGDYVIGFDNFFASSYEAISDISGHPCLEFFEYDINNPEQMHDIEQRVRQMKSGFGKIVYINCAAVVHTEYFYQVNATFETNVTGMRRFLEQAIAVGADTYINCSTSEVYSMKSWDEEGVSEADYILLATAEHSQRTSYATGKLLTEFMLRDAVENKQISGCSIRFANVYSKDERFSKHIIPHVIESLIKSGSVTLLENSRVNRRTFLHNIDSCTAVLALAGEPSALDGSVYNVATDEEISILDLVKLCAEKLNIENPDIRFEGHRLSDPERRILNTKKIRSRTSWSPRINLANGIEMCIQYRKAL